VGASCSIDCVFVFPIRQCTFLSIFCIVLLVAHDFLNNLIYWKKKEILADLFMAFIIFSFYGVLRGTWRMGSNSTEKIPINTSAESSETTIEIKIKTLDSQTYTLRVDKQVFL